MTNITKETANRIRSTIVATNGARFPRLSRHKVTNSTEWFFLIIMARRKGAINRIITRADSKGPQTPGKLSLKNGTRKRNAIAITATLTME